MKKELDQEWVYVSAARSDRSSTVSLRNVLRGIWFALENEPVPD